MTCWLSVADCTRRGEAGGESSQFVKDAPQPPAAARGNAATHTTRERDTPRPHTIVAARSRVAPSAARQRHQGRQGWQETQQGRSAPGTHSAGAPRRVGGQRRRARLPTCAPAVPPPPHTWHHALSSVAVRRNVTSNVHHPRCHRTPPASAPRRGRGTRNRFSHSTPPSYPPSHDARARTNVVGHGRPPRRASHAPVATVGLQTLTSIRGLRGFPCLTWLT